MAKPIRIFDKDILNRTDGTKFLLFKNFGNKDNGNFKSDYPNFNIVITDECADYLSELGFNVIDYKDRDDNVMHRLPIKVRFDNFPPTIYKKCGNKLIEVTEETLYKLDGDELICIDLWVNRSAKGATYLSKGIFEIEEDDFYAIVHGNGYSFDDDID